MTQASLSPSPKLRFFGTDGKPLSGGLLITYDYLTSLPVSTWNDAEMTVRNPAQLTLDANGEPSNNGVPVCVYLEDGRRYKYRWFDSNGTLIDSVGPVQTATITYGSNTTFNYYANVEGTIDEIVVDASTDPATGVKTYFVKLANAVKNTISSLVSNVQTLITNLYNEVTRAQNAESGLGTAIGNEVTRATGKENELGTAIANEVTRATAAEKAAKTEVKPGDNIEVTKTSGADGHDIYTIKGVESVPNVNITSPNSTISVSSSEDPQTNTKTFSIDVHEKPLSLAWVESDNMTFIPSTNQLSASSYSLLNQYGQQNPQGDKITYNSTTRKLSLAAGHYTMLVNFLLTWAGTPQNKTIFVNNEPFDLSYQHTQTVTVSVLHQLTHAVSNLGIGVTLSEAPPIGFTCKISRASIYSVQQVLENVVQGLTEVHHDETLSGTGTEDDPLSVEGGGGGLQEVAHDDTMTGDGTIANPLSVADDGKRRLVANTVSLCEVQSSATNKITVDSLTLAYTKSGLIKIHGYIIVSSTFTPSYSSYDKGGTQYWPSLFVIDVTDYPDVPNWSGNSIMIDRYNNSYLPIQFSYKTVNDRRYLSINASYDVTIKLGNKEFLPYWM